MLIPSQQYQPSVQNLAEEFANLDNHKMLEFFEAVTSIYKRDCKRGHFSLMDQYIAVVNDGDITQDTLTCLACLVRDSSFRLDMNIEAIKLKSRAVY